MQVYSLPYDSTSRTSVVLRLTNSGTDLNTPAKTKTSGDTAPTTTSTYMQFSGTQTVRFPNSTDLHVNGTYSVELEVYFDVTGNGTFIATYGEGYGIGWPEWHLIQNTTSINFASSTSNSANTTSVDFLTNYNLKQWYRIGFMFLSGQVYGFVNDIQVFNTTCALPYTTTNGLAVGGDFAKYAARAFTGKIRNLTIGKSAFWSVASSDVNTAPYAVTAPSTIFNVKTNSNVYIPIQFADAENNIKSYAISGGLPTGLSFDTASCIISGTTTSTTGSYNVTITATDYGNLTGTAAYTIIVSS